MFNEYKKQALAELVGTFFLVFFGTGAIIVDSLNGGALGLTGIALSFGLILTCAIYAVGEISGGHFNPAVSVGFFVANKIPSNQMVTYVIAQIVGAIAASALLHYLFPSATTLGETLPSAGLEQSFIMEVVLTFALMFVIINVATGSKNQSLMAGLAIGFTVLVGVYVGGLVSGGSMNPARSIGPALISGNTADLWAYLAAPVIGAVLAIFAWKMVKKK